MKNNSNILRWLNLLVLSSLLIFVDCGGESTQNTAKPSGSSGSISFALTFSKKPSVSASLAPAEEDVCETHGIETIRAAVANTQGEELVTESWPCADHSGELSDVPVDNGLVLILEGIVSGNVHWRGEQVDIQIVPSETTHVGTVMMEYVGGMIWGQGYWGRYNWQ
jgi:hypothetical protein